MAIALLFDQIAQVEGYGVVDQIAQVEGSKMMAVDLESLQQAELIFSSNQLFSLTIYKQTLFQSMEHLKTSSLVLFWSTVLFFRPS